MDQQETSSNKMPAIPTEGEWVYPPVAEFYRGKTVALTGGTGSVGQAIIEKLLRCCPQVKKIILLIRKKKDVEPADRLNGFLETEVFDAVRELDPNFADKLTCISCDLEAEDLGLSSSSKLLLQTEVDIFIHSAANLKFNEKFRLSYLVNVQCVRRVLKLCKGFPKLKALVHVSTAYSHCNRNKIEEKFYDCGVDYLEMESTMKCLSDEALARITPELLGGRPNTYTLTKALGEDAIARESGDLPVCIFRPSMIIPAWEEPLPGWTTNLYGPTAFFVAYAKGVLKSVILDQNIVGDIIPIDLVVNGIIVAGMKTACDFTDNPRDAREDLQRGPEVSFTEEGLSDGEEAAGTLVNIRRNIPIYNLTTSALNPIYVRDLVKIGKEWYREYPLDPHRLPGVTITCNRFVHNTATFFRQTIPAYIDDAILTVFNKERKMRNINQKIISGLGLMEFFFVNQWNWDGTNTENLRSILCPKDQEVFYFDPRCFSWKEHLRRYIIGTRKYLVKQDMQAYPAARKTLERMRLQRLVVNSIGAVGLLSLAWSSGAYEAAYDAFLTTYNMTSAYM